MGGNLRIVILMIVAILVMFALPMGIDTEKKQNAAVKNNKYQEVMANAVNDATKELLVPVTKMNLETLTEGNRTDYRTMDINKERALDTFYKSLYLNLNIDKLPLNQQAIFRNLPIKLATAYDGYYISSWNEIWNSKEGKFDINDKWSEKYPYTYIDKAKGIVVAFTLGEDVEITTIATQKKEKMTRAQANSKYPNSYFGDKFQSTKENVIFDRVSNDILRHTNMSNAVAKKHGWQYSLKTPEVDTTTLKDISFTAFLQGEGEKGTVTYNTYGVSLAKVVDKHKIYGYTQGAFRYYTNKYKAGCDRVFNSQDEAAHAGYQPDSSI